MHATLHNYWGGGGSCCPCKILGAFISSHCCGNVHTRLSSYYYFLNILSDPVHMYRTESSLFFLYCISLFLLHVTLSSPSSSPYPSLSFSLCPIAFILELSPEVSLTLGEEHTLQCSISLPDTLSATIASFTWYKDSSVITSGLTTNLAEGTSSLNLTRVLSAESGNYTCVANISSPYVDTGINLIVTNTTFLTVTSKNWEE